MAFPYKPIFWCVVLRSCLLMLLLRKPPYVGAQSRGLTCALPSFSKRISDGLVCGAVGRQENGQALGRRIRSSCSFQKHDYNTVYSKLVLSYTGRLISSYPVPWEKNFRNWTCSRRAGNLHLIFFWLLLLWTCVLASCWRQLRTELMGAVLSIWGEKCCCRAWRGTQGSKSQRIGVAGVVDRRCATKIHF